MSKVKKLKVHLFGDPVLREKAKPITVFHKKLHATIDSMLETLYSFDNAAAFAGNQFGVLKRIVVIDYLDEFLEMVNPEIIEKTGEILYREEGCMSFPEYFGKVPRYERVKVKYTDRFGKEEIIERSGSMARCLQHEIDHLDGVLFVDRMEDEFLRHANDKKVVSRDEVINKANGNLIDIQVIEEE